MLKLATRNQFKSLLDATTLTEPNGSDKAAITFLQTGADPVEVSRQQFYEQAASYAAALQHKGIKPRDLVVIAHIQNLESMFAFWGALLIGAVPSMFPPITEKLDPQIYMQNMMQLVELSGVKAILTTDEFAPQLAKNVTCPVYGSSALTAPSKQLTSNYIPTPSETAFLQHSSGTTGLQKGVALSHEAVLNQIASYSDALILNRNDVIVSWLPLYHDMGLIAGFILPIIQGIPLVIMSPFDWVSHPAMLFRAIDQYAGTLCWLPNFAYNHCVRRIRQRDLDGLSAATIRAFINCSEPVRHSSHVEFLKRFEHLNITPDKLATCYAMAENVFAVSQTEAGSIPKIDWINRHLLETRQQAVPANPGSDDAVVQVSCGKPISGVEVRVFRENNQPIDERLIGEIGIRSNCLLSEYYHRPDLQPVNAEGWHLTGDMGYIADGNVFVVGRYKDLIINAGKNVYPQDIEAIINQVPGVHAGRAVVFGVPDEREGTELIAAVVEVNTQDAAEIHRIERLIRQRVSQQSTVTLSFVQVVDSQWLIKTSSGKIARTANREKWQREREGN